jgi:hypothetical protein
VSKHINESFAAFLNGCEVVELPLPALVSALSVLGAQL